MSHRVGRVVFALIVGLAVAVYSYQWITNPAPREERQQEMRVVEQSRVLLRTVLADDGIEIVDPLAPDRKVGKVYVYPEGPGWAVSGYYRRNDQAPWRPYLLTMTEELALVRLKAKDPILSDPAAADPQLEIIP